MTRDEAETVPQAAHAYLSPTTSDRAVKKASRERLLRDFARAAVAVRATRAMVAGLDVKRATIFALAEAQTSRTRYACLMTAFGQ